MFDCVQLALSLVDRVLIGGVHKGKQFSTRLRHWCWLKIETARYPGLIAQDCGPRRWMDLGGVW
jgi:hypothetical protein